MPQDFQFFDGKFLDAARPPLLMRRKFKYSENRCSEFTFITVEPLEGFSGEHLIYLHGGSYANELIGPHWSIIYGLLRRTGAKIILLYPLAPRFSCLDALEFLNVLHDKLSLDTNGRYSIAGDSAGAGLALAFTLELRNTDKRQPASVILFSPWLDVSMNDPETRKLVDIDTMLGLPCLKWAGERWAGDLPIDDWRVSPLNGSLVNLPPIAIFTGSADLLYADALRFQRKAAEEKAFIKFYE